MIQKQIIEMGKTVFSACAVFLCSSASAATQDEASGLPDFREKTTLESFPLRQLESVELSAAGVDGALDAPEFGERTDETLEAAQNQIELELQPDKFDIGQQQSVPTLNDLRPAAVPPEGRIYRYEVNTTTR